MGHPSDPAVPQPPRWPSGVEPLIPILSAEDAVADPVALATWHEALSSALAVDVPHDLLALWLFPGATEPSEAVLLGPAALANDRLPVPLPSPYLPPAELSTVEDLVRRAGYASVSCLPIRFGRRDVGLLLIANLRPDQFGETEQVLLRWATQRLAPSFGRLARLWGAVDTQSAHAGERHVGDRLTGLIEGLGAANAEAGSPRNFAGLLSKAIETLLPHDHLELLAADAGGGQWLRLGEHAGGELWADQAFVIDREQLDIDALFGASDRLLVPDTYADHRWPRGFVTAAEPPGADLRALAGVRLSRAGMAPLYIVLGGIGPDLYRSEDVMLLERVAGLVRVRIESFVRPRPAVRERVAGRHPLAAVAELLATIADPMEALRLTADEARLLLPFHALHYVIRLHDDDRVVLVEPGERRALSDLPLVPIAGTSLAAVLAGEVPHICKPAHGESRLIVPLRVAGQIHGAIVLTATQVGAFNAVSITLAQRLADLMAPHFELLRRAVLAPLPYAPGWKRSGR